MLKLILACVYPAVIAGRLLNALTGRDPLRLREPAGGSYWIARAAPPPASQYFSESSAAEGRRHGGWGGAAIAMLRRIARTTAPAPLQPGERYSAAADREQGIPDEVYTLW